jgi:hypothetical protein
MTPTMIATTTTMTTRSGMARLTVDTQVPSIAQRLSHPRALRLPSLAR